VKKFKKPLSEGLMKKLSKIITSQFSPDSRVKEQEKAIDDHL